MLNIVEKGQTLNLNIASKQESPTEFYFGAGWDMVDKAVDLDLVALIHRGDKPVADADLIYFGNKKAIGVQLSEDNTTGEGDGDDESLIINTASLDADVTKITLGVVAYSSTTLAAVKNMHFRVVDGASEDGEQIADVKIADAPVGDTVLVGFTLAKTDDGFVLTNVEEYSNHNNGGEAVNGFAKEAIK